MLGAVAVYWAAAVIGAAWSGQPAVPGFYAGIAVVAAIVFPAAVLWVIRFRNRERSHEAAYDAVTTNLPGVVYRRVLRPDGTIEYSFIGERIRDFLAVGPDSLVGIPNIHRKFVHPDDLAAWEEALRKSAADLSLFDVEARVLRLGPPFGEAGWDRSIARPRRLPSGEIVWDGIALDITDRKKAEAASRDAELKFRGFAETAPVGIALGRFPDTTIIYANDEMARILGYKRSELIGQTAQLFIADPQDLENTIAALAATRVLKNHEFEVRRKDGSVISILASLSLMDLDGRSTLLIGGGYDITERKRAEEELRKLTSVVEQSPNIIVITDTEGRIEYVNPKFTAITGYTPEEAVGRTPSMLNSGTTPTEKYKALWETVVTGGVWHGEIMNRKKNGDFYWCRETIGPIRDVRGKITRLLAIEEDITEKRKIEEQLREAQKLESIGQLTGGIAHDFNNLLTVVLGNLELLSERVADNADLLRIAEQARRGALSAAELTQRLLAFGHRQPLHPEIVDLGGLATHMLGLLRRTLDATIALQSNLAAGLWQTLVDPVQVESAILNLVLNARDAMPAGGTITIETANRSLDAAAAAAYPNAAPGDYVMLAVSDTGSGMPPDVAARAFEPFFTTKEVGKGTGLGLSMIHGFITQSGGFVSLNTVAGHGTRVELYIPRTAVTRAAVAAAPAPVSDQAGRGETVLVVEDSPDVRALAATLLRGIGYQVREAGDGPSALAALENGAPIDVIFADIVMPGGMTGVDLAREARRRRPGIKVLFTTGYGREKVSEADVDAEPGTALINKPYRKADLARLMRQVLEGTR
jgi:PAS domain S-box-containing protein